MSDGKQKDDLEKELQECVTYFRERSVYRKIFDKMRDKYASLGHLGGSITFSGLRAEECHQLEGFFQRDFIGKKTITISYTAMEKALKNSRFGKLEWGDILTAYFGEELVAKRDRKLLEQQMQNDFFARILKNFPINPAAGWLGNVLCLKEDGYKLCIKQYREAPEQFEQTLCRFLRAVPGLPFLNDSPKQLLAVFAAETTGDPHFFDTGTAGEQLLTAYLQKALRQGINKTFYPMEQRAELYYEAGLLKDDLSNYTLVYGVHAELKDGTVHEGIEGFLRNREPLQLTLMTLGGLRNVSPQTEGQEKKRVYIVENPAVFSTLIQNYPDQTFVCGNGQIRLATLVLLDLFEEDTVFYYAGDYDPEGLQIAQKLAERYKERLMLWNYHSGLYERYRSDVELSPKRLKKLDGIYLPQLLELKVAMKRDKRAAYQETMLGEYDPTLCRK